MNKKILLILLTLLISCSHLPKSRNDFKNIVIQKIRPSLEKILLQENPINLPERSTYPLAQQLPGKPFIARNTVRSLFTYNSKGHLVLYSGDYVFPVMTYCMNSSASSPAGHIYSLSQLEGKRAKIIRDLNLLGPAKYFADEIQMVSWGIQNGLSYEELGKLGQEMVDSVIPYHKSDLKESILTQIERKWNQTSSQSGGILPSFNESAENLEESLGELGKRIREMREYRELLREVGYDYARLSELIDTTTRSQVTGNTTWSKVSSNVYARFLTKGSFGDIGYVQVRVLSTNSGREINSVNDKQEVLDIVSLIANPNFHDIQPLSFSPLYGVAGTVTLTPALSRHPLAGALLLAAVLSAKYIDWDAFFDLQDLLQNTNDRDVKEEIEKGMQTLSKEHDKLEKPLKEAGIIIGKTKNTSKNKNGNVREYTKDGGEEQLQKDFDKLPGKPIKSKTDGVEYKEYSEGTSIVKTPKKSREEGDDRGATLEVQPMGHPNIDSKVRIKVRYP
jgi:hypothetical protein